MFVPLSLDMAGLGAVERSRERRETQPGKEKKKKLSGQFFRVTRDTQPQTKAQGHTSFFPFLFRQSFVDQLERANS